jgi:hypothetical protein
MQMHDAFRQMQAGSLTEELAAAFAVAPARAEAVLRAVAPEFTWCLQKNTLSRGGLADLVEALGSGHHIAYLSSGKAFADAAARADGNAILGHLLGSKDASRGLAARAARRSGVDAAKVAAMLPHLAAVTMGILALRAQPGLGEIVAQVPPLGRLGCGNPHGDLAGILRRRCGAGRYSPRALPRAVRRTIGHAAGFPSRSVLVWYVRFMVGRAGVRVVRALVPGRPGGAAAHATHGSRAH